MSAFNAPTYYFTGIKFNSSYFATSNSALTTKQANALYLLKNTADTATALESFTGGILVNTISPTTASTTMNVGVTSTAKINIGTLGGRSAIIHIGDGDNNIAGSAVHINNGLNTASNVQILNGTGSTGTITLGSSTSTTNAAGTVNLGTSAKVLTVNVPLSINYTPSDITGTTQQGYSLIASANPTNSCTATDTVIRTIALTPGVWMVQGSLIWTAPVTSQIYAALSPTATTDNVSITSQMASGAGNPYISVSRFAVITTNTTYNLIGRSFAGATTILISTLNAVRIA
jgi:hypothetical protein